MSDIQRTPQESAEFLADSLNNNTTALNRVRNRNRIVMALVALVAVALLVVVKFNYDGNVSRCESGNELRTEENAKWDSVAAFLQPAMAANGLDEEEESFLILLSTDLELRDCSDVNWLGQ